MECWPEEMLLACSLTCSWVCVDGGVEITENGSVLYQESDAGTFLFRSVQSGQVVVWGADVTF